MNEKSISSFLKLARITLLLVYAVILAGAVVRATGSGMGCPDWPKCFGKWIPPTDSSQLAEGYKEDYVEKRKTKNEKFAKYLRLFGMNKTAAKIINDPEIYTELNFNATKTWIEYGNRLAGAVLGIFMILLLIRSVKFLKINRKIFFATLSAFILLLFEGWFGSIVVSTNLLTWTISLHMILALLLIFVMTYIISKAKFPRDGKSEENSKIKILLFFALSFTLIQILLGTQVREEVDIISSKVDDRSLWITFLSQLYNIHRTFGWIILALNVYVFYVIWKNHITDFYLFGKAKLLLVVIFLEVIAGIVLAYFSFPAAVQPAHLLLASIMFGLQSVMMMEAMNRKIISA